MVQHYETADADFSIDPAHADDKVLLTKTLSDGEPPHKLVLPRDIFTRMARDVCPGVLYDGYQTLAARTEKPLPDMDARLMHAALGMADEVGEFAKAIKGQFAYNKPYAIANLEEELGDLMWYIALACNATGLNMGRVAERNIEKLKLRYPEKYSDAAAIARADKPAGE